MFNLKKGNTGKYILFAVLLTLVAPAFIKNAPDNAVFSVGNSYVTQADLRVMGLLMQADGITDARLANIMFILREEAYHLSDPVYKLLGTSPMHCFGLTTTDDQVREYIANTKLFGEKFDEAQYIDFLNKMHITDIMFRDYVKQWLALKPLLYLLSKVADNIVLTPQFKTYAKNIMKSFYQSRSGTYQEIKLNIDDKYVPSQEEIEDYYITHQEAFYISPTIKIKAVKFININDKQWNRVIEDLRAGIDLSQAGGEKITKQLININVSEGNAQSDSIISDNLRQFFVEKADKIKDEKQLNKMEFLQEFNDKILYTITDFKPAVLKKFDQVKDQISDILKTKYLQKQALLAVKQSKTKLQKMGETINITVSLKDILPNHMYNLRYNDKKPLSIVEEKIGQALFTLGKNKKERIVQVNDSLYFVKLNENGIKQEEYDEKQLEQMEKFLAQQIFFKITAAYSQDLIKYYSFERFE